MRTSIGRGARGGPVHPPGRERSARPPEKAHSSAGPACSEWYNSNLACQGLYYLAKVTPHTHRPPATGPRRQAPGDRPPANAA